MTFLMNSLKPLVASKRSLQTGSPGSDPSASTVTLGSRGTWGIRPPVAVSGGGPEGSHAPDQLPSWCGELPLCQLIGQHKGCCSCMLGSPDNCITKDALGYKAMEDFSNTNWLHSWLFVQSNQLTGHQSMVEPSCSDSLPYHQSRADSVMESTPPGPAAPESLGMTWATVSSVMMRGQPCIRNLPKV